MNIEQPDALDQYLRQQGHISPAEELHFSRLVGGVSNRTVLVENSNGKRWVVKQALEKLRVPGDWFSDPERIHREALGLRWLHALMPPGTVPKFLFEDHSHHLMAMEAVPVPHCNWKDQLLAGEINMDHVTSFGRLLACMHTRGYARRLEIAPVFEDRSFFVSLRVDPYYRYVGEKEPVTRCFLDRLIAYTLSHQVTLVHGDYSPKNMLVSANRLVLLDHEVIHFGDPAFDVGFSLTHLLSKANHLLRQRDEFAAAAMHYWKTYAQGISDQAWSHSLAERAVAHTLGCLAARVKGRSRLEYLDSESSDRQFSAVVSLMDDPPDSVEELINRFVERLQGCHS